MMCFVILYSLALTTYLRSAFFIKNNRDGFVNDYLNSFV